MSRRWKSALARRRWIAGTLMLMALGAVIVVAASSAASGRAAGAGANPADAAATRSYLLAGYAYDETFLSNVPQSIVQVDALAHSFEGECPRLLAGAAQASSPLESEQQEVIEDEMSDAVNSATLLPDRGAVDAFAATVNTLHWSNPAITQLAGQAAARLQEQLTIAPDVCADARAWAASSFRVLPPASKAIEGARESRSSPVNAPARSLPELLKPYTTGPAARRILARAQALKPAQQKASSQLNAAWRRAAHALGAVLPQGEASQGAKPDSTEIGHGRTAAGETFVARSNLHLGKAPSSCRVEVTVTEAHGASFDTCTSTSQSGSEQQVNCQSGLLTISAKTVPSARQGRLLLSNGRRITSPVLLVPARLGGPIGIYYQAVRGPSPIPISLTELDAHGRTLRVLDLQRVVECTERPVKPLPGGTVTLVQEAPAQSLPGFKIVGERSSFLGQISFNLKIDVEQGGEGGESGSGGTSGVFVPRTASGCHPHPYEVIYGILVASGDEVLVDSSGRLVALHKLAIPARLHAGGVLVYGAFSTPPTELLVRNPQGSTVLRENRSSGRVPGGEECEAQPAGASARS